MRKDFLMLLLAIVSSSATAADSWLCISDSAVGFHYQKGAWAQANFRPAKYVISHATKSDVSVERVISGRSPVWVVKDFGQEYGTPCEDFNTHGLLACSNGIQEFRFNKNTERFLGVYLAGYYNVPPDGIGTKAEDGNTPVIHIGKCHPL